MKRASRHRAGAQNRSRQGADCACLRGLHQRSDALVAARPWRWQENPFMKVLMEPRLGGRWLEISEDGTETSVATIHALGAAASPGDALADQCAVEAGRRDEIGGRRPL